MKTWIAEQCSRARKTILIKANSRKEAQQKLDRDEGEGVDVTYYNIGRARVVRQERESNENT